MAMVGEHTKKTYRVGQPVKVTLTDVDMDQSQINFKLLPDENTPTSDLGDLVERPKPRRNFQRREGSNNRRPGGNSNRNGNSRGGYRGNRNSSSNGNSHNRQGASNGNRNHSGASTNSNRNRRGGNGNHPFTIRNNQSHGEHK